MNALYEKYQELNIDGSWIGLAVEENSPYFCTPVGAEIIGWDNGIHYCFIREFGDIVFCVNPESCCDYFVYPVAKDFNDFLRLILAVGNTNTIQQIIWWDYETFEKFINDPAEKKYLEKTEVVGILKFICERLDVSSMEDPFGYVKRLQQDFPYEKICFSDEYYDTLGLERLD